MGNEATWERRGTWLREPIEARCSMTMTALLEPMLIVVLGTMTGGIAFFILMPLMRVNEFVAG